MHSLYFAYGSNLAGRRMRERVRGARARGRARLAGYRITADKPGRDGSAKLNLARDPERAVWGVVWELLPQELDRLDVWEGGYERIALPVDADGVALVAEGYVSERRSADGLLARDYKALILEGAREHGLPAEWIALLDALPAR